MYSGINLQDHTLNIWHDSTSYLSKGSSTSFPSMPCGEITSKRIPRVAQRYCTRLRRRRGRWSEDRLSSERGREMNRAAQELTMSKKEPWATTIIICTEKDFPCLPRQLEWAYLSRTHVRSWSRFPLPPPQERQKNCLSYQLKSRSI